MLRWDGTLEDRFQELSSLNSEMQQRTKIVWLAFYRRHTNPPDYLTSSIRRQLKVKYQIRLNANFSPP